MKRESVRALVLLVATAGISCSKSSEVSGPSGESAGGQVKLQGAGATFPAPLYNRWFKAYGASHPDVQVDYQAVGSGSGVKSVIDKTVDFGASDAAMTPDEMKQVDVGVQLFPMTAGSIVLAYNLPGVDTLQLSRSAYVGIFLGKVTKWNDPIITGSNPGVTLPDEAINVVTRADGSGTSYVFSQHLSTIDDEFAKKVGKDKAPNWPVGTKQKGNDGVAASISTTPASIGYVEYTYAKGTKLKFAKLQNKAGKFVEANEPSAQAALASTTMPDDLIAWLPDPDGDGSYPIVTYTWIICYKQYSDAAKAKALKDILTYCLTDGQKEGGALGYIALPDQVIQKAKGALANITSGAAAPAPTSAK